MKKQQFEELVNVEVTDMEFEKIYYVWANCEAIYTKPHFARLFTTYGMAGIEVVWRTIQGYASLAEMKTAVEYIEKTQSSRA